MDKEAQEKIVPILFSLTRWMRPERGGLIERLASDILAELGELGYRKLPEGEPPLIDVDAEAQRQTDIRWYTNALS